MVAGNPVQRDWLTQPGWLLQRGWLTRSCFAGVFCVVALGSLVVAGQVQETTASELLQSKECFERQSEWHGFSRLHFRVGDRKAYLVAPKTAGVGNPWVWRARFPDYHSEADQKLLAAGFHVAYVDVAGMFGSPRAVEIGNQFYAFLVGELHLAYKPALEAVSRGGLFAYNWALANPHRVACIYCDTPVLDFNSWPRGSGSGVGHPGVWKQCKTEYGLSDEQANSYGRNPVDRATEIADTMIPLLHIVSENDRVVPPNENTYRLQQQLDLLGGSLPVISVEEGTQKSQGHHFEHPDVARVVSFVIEHGSVAQHRQLLDEKSKRILFLGDSITYSGDFVTFFDMWLDQQKRPEGSIVINAGLPSETVSGLSEKGHAGGRFPRPDLHDRLDKVLDVTKPDLVFACYGMNCGIYQPFDAQRFDAFKQGVNKLKAKVDAAGAMLILMTPPIYDRRSQTPGFDYDDVLKKYSQWICTQGSSKVHVFDLHTALSIELKRRKQVDPSFTYQPDKVHPNQAGHWRIAAHLANWFGDASLIKFDSFAKMSEHEKANRVPEFYTHYRKRMELYRNCYLTVAGHARPGIKAGLSVPETEALCRAINEAIQSIKADVGSPVFGAQPAGNEKSRKR